MEKERKMTTNGHMKGSNGSCNRVRKDASIIGMKKICHEYDKKMVELEERLSTKMKQLSKKMKEH